MAEQTNQTAEARAAEDAERNRIAQEQAAQEQAAKEQAEAEARAAEEGSGELVTAESQTNEPERQRNGRLTRFGMEQAIREGGSVQLGDRTITRVDDLPSAAELAKGDPDAERAALSDLQKQMADLQTQIAKLQ